MGDGKRGGGRRAEEVDEEDVAEVVCAAKEGIDGLERARDSAAAGWVRARGDVGVGWEGKAGCMVAERRWLR
jgi:hypothetical protein